MEFRVLAGIFANNRTFLRPFPKGWINSLWLHYNNAKHDKNVKNLFLLSQNIFGLVNKLCEIGLPMEVIIHYPLWYDNEGDYQQNQTFVWKAWIPPNSHFFLIYYLKKMFSSRCSWSWSTLFSSPPTGSTSSGRKPLPLHKLISSSFSTGGYINLATMNNNKN